LPGLRLTRGEFVERYRVGYEGLAEAHTRLFDGVEELVSRLATPLAIASSKPSGLLREHVQSLGITHRFAHIQGTDGFPYKPDPTIIHRVWERVPASPRGTVFVGDAMSDILAGCAAGVVPVGVTYGAHSAAELRGAGAEFVVDDIESLGALLD
jgi:phosphoglycolate phosphatase